MQTRIFILGCLFIIATSNLIGNDIILSKTGNTQLDGVYKPFNEVDGSISFVKNTAGITFKISRFKLKSNNSVVSGWTISDANNKEYFAVTDESLQVPAQGWDVGRAGIGLNVNFDLTFNSNSTVKAIDFTLTNALNLDVKVYPNPTFGEIAVETSQPLQNLSLVNNNGQVILSSPDNRLDLSNLPNGVYNLIIKTNNSKLVKRIVKN